jgi:hypothetical protein
LTPGELLPGLQSQRAGLLLSLIAVLSGFALGGVFGAFEEELKASLAESAESVLVEAYAGDGGAAQEVVEKAWVYYQRAHLHWGGIGAATLAVSLLLSIAVGPSLASRLASLAMGLGALTYPAYWLLAGRTAPRLGGTGAAKASLEWLAVPSAGLLLLGTSAALVLLSARLFGSRPS